MSDYYDRAGNPISLDEWIKVFKDNRVEYTDVGGDGIVRTVYLGLNHNWGEGPPLIFETMVFGGPLDGECDRYSTEQAAVDGHREICERARQEARSRNG